MAIRRSNPDGTPTDEAEDPLGTPFGSSGTRDEFGNVIPDFSNDPNYPVPFVDYQPDEIAGNTESARELGGGFGPPRGGPAPAPLGTPVGPPMGQPPGGPSEDSFGLPQGVSVNEGMFAGVPESGNAMNVPGQSRTPSPTSGMAMNAPPESGTSQGPMRRSASSPSIYGESRNPTMFGRAGGLLGGGKGLVGREESSGPVAPTEMMKKLLALFQQQG